MELLSVFSFKKGKASIQKFGRYIWAIALLPWTAACLWQLPFHLESLKDGGKGILYFFSGVVFYAIWELTFSKPMRIYVFGHELTHALAAWMIGGKVSKMKVSKNGGSVTVSKSNAFVALAPYMIPLYTLLAIGVFYAASYFWDLSAYENILIAVVGMTLAFHFSLTVHAIVAGQPDIQTTGRFFSFIWIALTNVWLVAGAAAFFFNSFFSLRDFFHATWQTQNFIWIWGYGQVRAAGIASFDFLHKMFQLYILPHT